MENLKKFVIDEDQRESIEKILYKETKLQEFIEKNYNISDILKIYDSIKLDFLDFYYLMPKISVFSLISKNYFRKLIPYVFFKLIYY